MGLVRHPPELAPGHGVLALVGLVESRPEYLELEGPEEGCEAFGPHLWEAMIAVTTQHLAVLRQ